MSVASFVLKDFNILATTERIKESRARSELWMLLRVVGDDAPVIGRVGIWGIIIARTKLEPVSAVTKMRDEFLKKPDSIQALYRVIPIQQLVPSTLEDILEATMDFSKRIHSEESYRITVEKRRTHLSGHEIINVVAEGIDKRVNLDNPDWIILIEIVGKITGISIVHPINILNTQKERVYLAAEAKKRTSFNNKLT